MIDSNTVQTEAHEYKWSCIISGRSPTFSEMVRRLGCSSKTIANVYRGTYNGHRYKSKPSHLRCIDNSDFAAIRSLYEGCKVV